MNEESAAAQSRSFSSHHAPEVVPVPSLPPVPDRRVEQVMVALRENLQRDFAWDRFDWDHFAGQFNLSLRHLERLFKAAQKPTPPQCLHQLRLERARELVLNSNDTAQEIAGKVGFKHENYFSREFKRVYGLPPIAYRKQHGQRAQTAKISDVVVVQEMSE